REDARKGSARSPRPRPAPSRKVPRALRERETIDTPSARPGGAVVRPAVGALASATKSSTGATDAPTATRPARSGTVAIIGRPNVGKSTLLNAALEVPLAIVTPAPQTTRETLLGVVHRIVDGSPCELALLDTPGLHKAERALDHRMNRAARDAASGADVVVFVADASGAVEHTGVHPGDAALLGDLGAGSRAVLVLNKIDRVKDKARLLPLLEAYAHARAWDSIVPLSARKPDGVDRLLDEIGRLLPEGEHRYGEDDLTDRPARFFAKEYVREQILLFARQEVPHAAAVSIDAFEEGTASRVTRVAATIHVEREGQKKILVGTGGSMLKQIGTDARMRLQEIVGFPVHLELFVRVTPGWRDAPAMLEELGIGSDGENS
ncbi:MAG TPA: GTPase Era, partial [Polyangiaceae bacterium]|nr:GTPase Era [Polyangiaceae bacterium]